MKSGHPLRRLWLTAVMAAAATAAAPSIAQISVNINIAPPAPRHEVAPAMAPGYLWVPGYWAWNQDRHVWIRGRTIVQREGYRWEPDRWEPRGDKYYRLEGHWERDDNYKPVKVKKEKKEKKSKHWKNDDDDRSGHGGRDDKHGKGHDKHH